MSAPCTRTLECIISRFPRPILYERSTCSRPVAAGQQLLWNLDGDGARRWCSSASSSSESDLHVTHQHQQKISRDLGLGLGLSFDSRATSTIAQLHLHTYENVKKFFLSGHSKTIAKRFALWRTRCEITFA